jgi:hypothetical protein
MQQTRDSLEIKLSSPGGAAELKRQVTLFSVNL